MDAAGLRAPCCGIGGTFVLALEAVPDRLGTVLSGVREVMIVGARDAGGEMGACELVEDREASELAEAIASLLTDDQPSSDILEEGDRG